jgi:hypothetical protein
MHFVHYTFGEFGTDSNKMSAPNNASELPPLVVADTGHGPLPPFGAELGEYVQTLHLPAESAGHHILTLGSKNIPATDLTTVIEKVGTHMSEANLRAALAMNLLTNRICEQCGEKPHFHGALKLCTSCCLAWYCDKSCQRQHWGTHQLRCCKPDGPLNKGYQEMAFGKVE